MRITLLSTVLLLHLASLSRAEVDFDKSIKPILESRCLKCHNPNNKKGDLSLARIDFLIQSRASTIVPGKPLQSELYLAIGVGDSEERPQMPKDSTPLSKNQRNLIRQWIKEGAKTPAGAVLKESSRADKSWWAYQPLKQTRAKATIDQYIRERLAKDNLSMNGRADKRTLIRRATYDLTGLPPSYQEVESFLKDQSPQAYKKLINRLLDSPQYGERWGQHWLDVIRFGESRGFEQNHLIDDAWPFRDYVIQSINDDKPFNQLIREHLAGDVFGIGNPTITVGSAFLVAGPADSVGNGDPIQTAQTRANTVDEIIRATGEAFLAMTIGCARCHDHKFDPISQNDYYQLYATFAAVKHGSAILATPKQIEERDNKLTPLTEKKTVLEKQLKQLEETVVARAKKRMPEFEAKWTRKKVNRAMTIESFPPVMARFVRLICLMQDEKPEGTTFNLDELEVWSTGESSKNMALAANGAKATGKARTIDDFPNAYGPQLAIDGKFGERFIAASDRITVELPEIASIDRVIFSSARNEEVFSRGEFKFVADYRIEVSLDGETWKEVANGYDRKPANEKHLRLRLYQSEISPEERSQRTSLSKAMKQVKSQIAAIPELTKVWLGTRDHDDATKATHVFIGGNPQVKGDAVVAASLSTLSNVVPTYKLRSNAPEAERRQHFANWVTHPKNPLTARVLANRVWHYHFGTGIVDTPSDFGYMGGRPTHPELLDHLATTLQASGWRLKALHRTIMLSDAYRQSSKWRATAAKLDGDDRLLWRFPPRRLSAEEIRDTMLSVSGKLDRKMGGPGFRLYRYLRDNVSTYKPLDKHGKETYRRAIYHQNARASVVDLMTEFDQPDCAFSTPRRVQTISPLQALTMLNHSFTIDMSKALASCIKSTQAEAQANELFQLALQRRPDPIELDRVTQAIKSNGLSNVCRAILNCSELIHLD